jgi:ribonuclease Z
MFELVFLGTSASAPSVQRGLSAQVVMHEEYRFLADCLAFTKLSGRIEPVM